MGADEAYSITSPALVIADHTQVPDSLRGTGAGLALVTRRVQDARAEGFRIMPLCPFVNAQPKRHPEWADAFTVQLKAGRARPAGSVLDRPCAAGVRIGPKLVPAYGQLLAEMILNTQGSVTSSGGVRHRPWATCQAASTLGT